MMLLTRFLSLGLIGVALCLSTGCRKTPQATADAEIVGALAKVPGAADVKAAIEKKDYDAALANLFKAKTSVATEEQQVQFMALNHWVKGKLMDAAPTDPKAAEALNALRATSVSR